jgi:hypothetical protein
MFGRYSVSDIVLGQSKTICDDGNIWANRIGVVCFFGVPALSPIIQASLALHLTESLVSIIISAASIFAGLLLNLLVVIYGFAPQAASKSGDKKTDENLERLIEYCFYNISYAVLISGLLVVFSLIFLTGIRFVQACAELLVYYFGFQLFLSIMQILKRCHSLLNFRLTHAGRMRANEASELWDRK